jgi:hypothetical protein
MDIPSALVGLIGASLIVCWLFSEWRSSRALIRIGLGLAGMLLVTFAASHAHMADVYLQGRLLRGIRRELSSDDSHRALRALEEYDRVYESTRDHALAAIVAAEMLHATAGAAVLPRAD